MRTKEDILGDIDNLPFPDRNRLSERAKLEVLCDIQDNLSKMVIRLEAINIVLKDICQHLETGVTVYSGKL